MVYSLSSLPRAPDSITGEAGGARPDHPISGNPPQGPPMVALDPTKPCQAVVSPCTINPMRIVDVIADAWGWKGVCPSALVLQNAFGNLIFLDEHGQYWRICPEELSCEIVATNEEHFAKLQNTPVKKSEAAD